MRYLTLLISLFIFSMSSLVLAQEEENDTPDGADRTSASGRKTEELYAPEDVDFFRFDIREDRNNPEHNTSGNLTVHFSQNDPPESDINVGWRVDLYAEEDLANSLYTAIMPETQLELTFEQALAPGRYYYKISSLNAEKVPSKEYTLDGSWEESEFYEKPPNKTPNTATPLKVNNLYTGHLSTDKDIDFYKFALTTNDTVTLLFKQDTPGADATVGWNVSLFAENSVGSPLQEVKVPATRKSALLQADLGVGSYYIRVLALTETKKAPKGRNYQLQVTAPTTVAGNLCPKVFTYAQNPVSTRWVAFPSHCDVPRGWYSTQMLLPAIESCPSPYTIYRASDGSLRIPAVEAFGETGESMGVWRVNLQQIPAETFLLEVLTDTLRQIQ